MPPQNANGVVQSRHVVLEGAHFFVAHTGEGTGVEGVDRFTVKVGEAVLQLKDCT